MITILFIALSLSLDSFVTSVSLGIKNKKHALEIAILIALTFGLCQSLMTATGYFIGFAVKNLISQIDHWVAFFLLTGVGLKFIFESFEESDKTVIKNMDWKMILILGIATSIDAMAVGVTFAFIDINIILSLITIGIITFLLSLLGYKIGKKFHHLNSKKLESFGGFILIMIGLKILISHLFF